MEGGNKYILTWENLARAPMHNNCNAPLVSSLFRSSSALLPLFFLLCRRTRACVYASATSLARLYSTANVSAFVRLELLHCLPVGKYYSNRQPRGVTIMFSFTTNPSRPHRFYRWRGFRKREERTLE